MAKRLLFIALWTFLFTLGAVGPLLYVCGSYFLDHGPPHGFGVPNYPLKEWANLWETIPFVGAGLGFLLGLFGLLPGTGFRR